MKGGTYSQISSYSPSPFSVALKRKEGRKRRERERERERVFSSEEFVRAPEVWIHEIPQTLMLLFPCQQKKQTNNNNNKRNIIFFFGIIKTQIYKFLQTKLGKTVVDNVMWIFLFFLLLLISWSLCACLVCRSCWPTQFDAELLRAGIGFLRATSSLSKFNVWWSCTAFWEAAQDLLAHKLEVLSLNFQRTITTHGAPKFLTDVVQHKNLAQESTLKLVQVLFNWVVRISRSVIESAPGPMIMNCL